MSLFCISVTILLILPVLPGDMTPQCVLFPKVSHGRQTNIIIPSPPGDSGQDLRRQTGGHAGHRHLCFWVEGTQNPILWDSNLPTYNLSLGRQ